MVMRAALDAEGAVENPSDAFWGAIHEFNHHFQRFGFAPGDEVTNNAVSLVEYSLFTRISSNRAAGGGDGGKQDIVMSMICGEDAVFEKMQETAHDMYAAEHAYVMTSEQIAFLEPTLVELLGATCLYAMAETVDEAERRGINRDAAVSFLTGHIYNLTCNFLGYIPGKPPVSDACKVAIGLGNRLVMRDDWKRIWDDEVLHKVIATMLHPEDPKI